MNLIEADQNLFLFINSFVGKSPLFDSFAKLLVNEYFVPTVLSLILFALWFFWDRKDKDLKQKSTLLGVLGVGLGSLVVVTILNMMIQRPRPFDVLDVNLLFYKPTDPSFPSNATVVAFALASAAYIAEKRLGAIALILASFYGLLRVFVGVHFPLDVIAGAFIGIASVSLINLFGSILLQTVNLLRNMLKMVKLEEFS